MQATSAAKTTPTTESPASESDEETISLTHRELKNLIRAAIVQAQSTQGMYGTFVQSNNGKIFTVGERNIIFEGKAHDYQTVSPGVFTAKFNDEWWYYVWTGKQYHVLKYGGEFFTANPDGAMPGRYIQSNGTIIDVTDTHVVYRGHAYARVNVSPTVFFNQDGTTYWYYCATGTALYIFKYNGGSGFITGRRA